MEEEILCIRWGKCKATTNCPLRNTILFGDIPKLYVLGKCVGSATGLVKIKR